MNAHKYRFSVVGTALAAFIAMSCFYRYGNADLYKQMLTAWGIIPFRFPFVDISESLAAWDCARQGIDVMVSNPCDVLQRSHTYSPILMALAGIPLGVPNTAAVGWTLGLLFILSLYLLPAPKSGTELVLMVLATLSTMVVFAVERANVDILMFMMALIVAFLCEGRAAARLLGYGVALAAALIKYYPITILILVFRERIAVLWAVLAAALAVLALFWAEYHADIVKGMVNIGPKAYNTDLFAAPNLPCLIGGAIGDAAGSQLIAQIVSAALYLVLIGFATAIWRRLLGWMPLRTAFAALPQRDGLLLVTGSAVIFGCFFAAQNTGYRGVFLLMVLPGLLTLARTSTEVSRLVLVTAILIVFLMWGECLRMALYDGLKRSAASELLATEIKIQFWLWRELCWWWVITVMAVVLTDFLGKALIVYSKPSIFNGWQVRLRGRS